MRISDRSSDVCSSDLRQDSFCGFVLVVIPDFIAQDAVLRDAGVGGELEAAADGGDPGIDVARKHDDRRGKLATQQAQVSFILVRACLLEQILQKREVPCGQSATGRSGHGKPPSRPNRSEEHTSELQSLMRISYAVFCLQKQKR